MKYIMGFFLSYTLKKIKYLRHKKCGFTGVVTHPECWENTRKACKSRAEDKITLSKTESFSCFL